MAEETRPTAAKTPAEAKPEPRPRLALPAWLPLGRIPRRWLIYGGVAAFLILAAVVAVVPWLLGVDQDDLETLGYPGIFVANFLGTATVFVPVPGLTAAGQALIVAGAETLNPVAVVAVGAAGMTLAESTAYLAGRIGRQVQKEGIRALRERLGQEQLDTHARVNYAPHRDRRRRHRRRSSRNNSTLSGALGGSAKRRRRMSARSLP